jgi:hypothetical protein
VSSNGSEPLLRSFLEHDQELDLDSAQIAELSRLYWSKPLPIVAETIAAIEQRLSAKQFRKSIGYIAASPDRRRPRLNGTPWSGFLVRGFRDGDDGWHRRYRSCETNGSARF